MKPLVQREGTGLVLDVMASRVSIRVRAEDTGGAFSVVEIQVPRGFQAPPILHRHSNVDWYALVEDGEIAIELDGVEHHVGRGGLWHGDAAGPAQVHRAGVLDLRSSGARRKAVGR